jgi:hypothetical protein
MRGSAAGARGHRVNRACGQRHLGDCPNFRGHRGAAAVGENGTVPLQRASVVRAPFVPQWISPAFDEIIRRVLPGLIGRMVDPCHFADMMVDSGQC